MVVNNPIALNNKKTQKTPIKTQKEPRKKSATRKKAKKRELKPKKATSTKNLRKKNRIRIDRQLKSAKQQNFFKKFHKNT